MKVLVGLSVPASVPKSKERKKETNKAGIETQSKFPCIASTTIHGLGQRWNGIDVASQSISGW